MFGDKQSQLERGNVIAFFHRADGLAARAHGFGQAVLGDADGLPQLAHAGMDRMFHAERMPCFAIQFKRVIL